MSNDLNDCRRIIDDIFCRPDLPADLRDRFAEWMLAHEHDDALQRVMLEMWATTTEAPGETSIEGLERLLKSVEADSNIGSAQRRDSHRPTLWWSIAAAATLGGALFAGGWWAASHVAPQGETLLVTAPGSTGRHTLPDGTEVWLNADSRLSYTGSLDGDVRQVNLCGEAYFNVAADREHPFRVVMDSLTIEVTGTAFDAINYPYAPEQVALQRGSVTVTSVGAQEPISLQPEQIVTRLRGRSDVEVVPAESMNYCGWMTHKITFDNRRLADIITNIERRYAVCFDIRPGVDLDKRLSLTIGGENLDETTRLLEMLMPIAIEARGNRLTIKPKASV